MQPLSPATLMTDDTPSAETDPSEGVPSAAEERHRQLDFQRRQLFAQAQEKFASADFDGARRCLEEIAVDHRTADVKRLFQLVAQRLSEIDRLGREIESNLKRRVYDELPAKVRRYLELQPGDEWAGELLHEIEDENARLYGEFEHLEATPAPPRRRRRKSKSRTDRTERKRRTPSRDAAVPVEIVPDDAPVDAFDDDAWEFGERLAVPVPPPLRTARKRRHDDDRDDLIVEPSSEAGVWIAVAVSGLVILLSVIVTVTVLVLEKT